MNNRYSNIATAVDSKGRKYRSNTFYPEVSVDEDDIYIIATEGDRYDKLALQFYHNSSYWWIILAANEIEEMDSIVAEPGKQLRIPAHPENYLEKFRNINS